MTITNTSSPDFLTGFPEVGKKWSGVDVANFSGYYEALQARLIDYSWNDASLKQEILTNPKVVFERETGITFPTCILTYAAWRRLDLTESVYKRSG